MKRVLLPLLSLCFGFLATGATQSPANTSGVGAGEPLQQYKTRIEEELRRNILPFWLKHVPDRKRGGFYGEITHTLQVKKEANRGSLLTSRILWTFSAAYRRYGDTAYLEMARRAWNDLNQRFWDHDHGGVYWLTSADGKILNPRKQVYGQVFAIYALSEYHRATGDEDAREKAILLYRLLEKHAKDAENGGYFEVCTRKWKRETDPKGTALETFGTKSQNTHLHVMEAYTNLLRIWPSDELKASQRALVGIMLDRILDRDTAHLGLFFTDDWKPRTEEISFGHDIEASWLLTEAADVLGDRELAERIKPIAVRIAHVTRQEGVAPDGSLLYEATPRGVTRDEREWWPQAEAVVGFFNAYQLTGDTVHRDAALRVWDYIEAHLVDRSHGEWYRAVSAGGVVSTQPKVSLWKCPYHNGRACLEMVARIERVQAMPPPESGG